MTPDLVTQSIQVANAATNDEEWMINHGLPGEWRLEAAYWNPQTAIAAHASNYVDLDLNVGAGGSSIGNIATDSASGAAWVKGTPTEFSLSEGTSREFGPTDTLELAKVESGTMATATEGTLTLRWRKLRV